MVLLQAGQKLEALAQAALIRCEHVRAEAIKLVERSQPFTAGVRADERPVLVRRDTVLGLLCDQMATHLDRQAGGHNERG
jgi:hypothetical protein